MVVIIKSRWTLLTILVELRLVERLLHAVLAMPCDEHAYVVSGAQILGRKIGAV